MKQKFPTQAKADYLLCFRFKMFNPLSAKERCCPHSLLHASPLLTPSCKHQTPDIPFARVPACSITHLPRIGVFLQIPIKKENSWDVGHCPGRGVGAPCQPLSVGMDVFCCGLFLLVESPWDLVWTPANREKLNPKVRQRRERGWSEAGSMSTHWSQPHSRMWAVGRGKPNWKCGWSRNEEALSDEFSGGCHEFFNTGKT